MYMFHHVQPPGEKWHTFTERKYHIFLPCDSQVQAMPEIPVTDRLCTR